MSAATPNRPVPLGVLVNLQTSSVPGFAPIGLSAEHYSSWCWGPSALPEVVLHHREHHPEVSQATGFLSQLDLRGFDPDAIATFAVTLGAGELIAVARDTDGISWWPASSGPTVGRDVVRELAAAARSQDLRFGIACPDSPNAHEDIEALIKLYRPDSLRVLASTAASSRAWSPCPTWATTTVIDQHDVAQEPGIPWELRYGAGPSLGWNRAESDRDLVSPADVTACLARTVARGGRLVLDLPLRFDGTIDEAHQAVFAATAPWLDRHLEALTECDPFDGIESPELFFLSRSGPVPGRRTIVAIDVDGADKRTIAPVTPRRHLVESVAGAGSWRQDTAGLHLTSGVRAPSSGARPEPAVYTFTIDDDTKGDLAIRGQRRPGAIRIGDTPFDTIGDALVAADPGQIVVVGPGRYGPETETYPLAIPAGVTVTGPRPIRRPTALGVARSDSPMVDLEASGRLIEFSGDGAALKQVRVVNVAERDEDPTIVLDGVSATTIEACDIIGSVELTAAPHSTMRWNHVTQGSITIAGSDEIVLMGNHVSGPVQGTAITLRSSSHMNLEANSIFDTEIGIDAYSCTGLAASTNAVEARHTAIRVTACDALRLTANRLRAIRALHLLGGNGPLLIANAVESADTAILLDASVTDILIQGTYVANARIGVLIWDAHEVTLEANRLTACTDHGIASNPDLPATRSSEPGG